MAVVAAAHEHAHAGAHLAHVAREGHERCGSVAGDVGVAHLVVAAPAQRQAGRTLGVLAGKLADGGGGHAAYAFSPLGSVLDLLLLEEREHRGAGCAVHVEGALESGLHGRDVVGRLRVRRRVPHEEGVLLAGLGLFGVRILRVVAHELARRDVHEERKRGVVQHEVLVVELLVEDDAGHAEEECGIGARRDGHPLIRFAGRRGEVGIHRHHAGASFLRLEEQAHVGQTGLQEVAAHVEHELGIHPVASLAGGHRVAAAETDGRIQTVADAHVDAGAGIHLRAQHGGQPREVRFGARRDDHAVVSVLALELLELVAHLVERFVPRDRLELARAALSGASKRGLHAMVAVDVLDLGNALHADGFVPVVAAVVRLNRHHAPVAHRARQRAHAAAVGLVVGERRVLLGGLGMRRNQPSVSGGHRPRRAQHRQAGARDGGSLDETPTRHAHLVCGHCIPFLSDS